MNARHFLYPLNPKAKQGYFLKDSFGNVFPTSVAGFFECYRNGESAEWGVKAHAKDLKKDDMIWVHFSRPVSAIMAVGTVRQSPHPRPDWGRDAIWIDWNWDLTKRLQTEPIPLAVYKQVTPVAVREANIHTKKVLERWLAGTRVAKRIPISVPVSFKSVLVAQRLGQPDFRQALLVAYDYRCAISGCDIRDALQAAHIDPVAAGGRHSLSNGLILRADLHNLFDRGLITITDRYTVNVDVAVRRSSFYAIHHGKKLVALPEEVRDRPAIASLRRHRNRHKKI